jgi:hypothetical protein
VRERPIARWQELEPAIRSFSSRACASLHSKTFETLVHITARARRRALYAASEDVQGRSSFGCEFKERREVEGSLKDLFIRSLTFLSSACPRCQIPTSRASASSLRTRGCPSPPPAPAPVADRVDCGVTRTRSASLPGRSTRLLHFRHVDVDDKVVFVNCSQGRGKMRGKETRTDAPLRPPLQSEPIGELALVRRARTIRFTGKSAIVLATATARTLT